MIWTPIQPRLVLPSRFDGARRPSRYPICPRCRRPIVRRLDARPWARSSSSRSRVAPYWPGGLAAMGMALGDKLLDASGNRLLDADGNRVPSNAAGDACCCSCPGSGFPCTFCDSDLYPQTYAMTISGVTQQCDWPLNPNGGFGAHSFGPVARAVAELERLNIAQPLHGVSIPFTECVWGADLLPAYNSTASADVFGHTDCTVPVRQQAFAGDIPGWTFHQRTIRLTRTSATRVQLIIRDDFQYNGVPAGTDDQAFDLYPFYGEATITGDCYASFTIPNTGFGGFMPLGASGGSATFTPCAPASLVGPT